MRNYSSLGQLKGQQIHTQSGQPQVRLSRQQIEQTRLNSALLQNNDFPLQSAYATQTNYTRDAASEAQAAYDQDSYI